MIFFWSTLFIIFSIVSCNKSEEHPEVIEKMRSIGVSLEPVIAVPSNSTNLFFHIMVPGTMTDSLTFQSLTPSGARFPITEFTIDSVTLAPNQDHSGVLTKFSYYKIMATIGIPSEASLGLSASNPSTKLEYLVFISGDKGSQLIKGEVPVFISTDEIHQETTGRNLSVAIEKPGSTANPDAKVDLSGTISNKLEIDQGKIIASWFISGGEIKNRKDISTEWKSPKEAGDQNIILTARGKYSKEFAVAFKKITIGP